MSKPFLIYPPAVDGQAFADAVSRLTGTVAIVTWQAGGPRGLLVRAVNLLSTRPARVLFGVGKDEAGHDDLLGAESCALNLLSDLDEAEAERFAAAVAPENKFASDRWQLRGRQPPRLLAGAAYLSGVVDHRIDARSHSLFVISVDTAEVKDGAPLVYCDHGFRKLAQTAGGQTAGSQGAETALSPESASA